MLYGQTPQNRVSDKVGMLRIHRLHLYWQLWALLRLVVPGKDTMVRWLKMLGRLRIRIQDCSTCSGVKIVLVFDEKPGIFRQ